MIFLPFNHRLCPVDTTVAMAFRAPLAARSFCSSNLPPKLIGQDREVALQKIPAWSTVQDRDAIQRSFQFNDFKEAWGFMDQIAVKAEEMGHHPEWFNVYNSVDITLASHFCDGVSPWDIELALFIDSVLDDV